MTANYCTAKEEEPRKVGCVCRALGRDTGVSVKGVRGNSSGDSYANECGGGSRRGWPMVVVEVSLGCCPGPLTLLGPLGYCPPSPCALESRFHSVRRFLRDSFSSSFLFVSIVPPSPISAKIIKCRRTSSELSSRY